MENLDGSYFNNKENSIAPHDQLPDDDTKLITLRRSRTTERHCCQASSYEFAQFANPDSIVLLSSSAATPLECGIDVGGCISMKDDFVLLHLLFDLVLREEFGKEVFS